MMTELEFAVGVVVFDAEDASVGGWVLPAIRAKAGDKLASMLALAAIFAAQRS